MNSEMTMPAMTGFEVHALRGRFNAAFFSLLGPYLNWSLRHHKRRLFAELPPRVVELGSGVGANLRYLPPAQRSWPSNRTPTCTPGCRPPPRTAACTSSSTTVSPSAPACPTTASTA